MNLLEVKGLRTYFYTDDGIVRAVDDVSFSIKPGQTLAIVGESGCGKTVTALSILRLIPEPPGKIVGGEVNYKIADSAGPVDLLKLSSSQMRGVRGNRIAMIFQEPMTALDPVYKIGDQIGEAIELHDGGSKASVRARVIEMLGLVGIPAPKERVNDYPHQLSGGMRQRVMIAMALSCRPGLLISDEPTTALDVTVQAQILDLIRKLQSELGMAQILVTHDLGVVAEMADEVAVMYAGKVVEMGNVDQIFADPKHPYTQGLLRALPPLKRQPEGTRLEAIPGTVPSLANLPKGCAFADRCPNVTDSCRLEAIADDPCGVGRLVRCINAETVSSENERLDKRQ
jgi:peptide/nickel transport system ATP-binding protein